MNYMQQKTRFGTAAEVEDAPFRPRVYRKTELAQLYFPQAGKKTALQGLARWIKRCTELEKALEAAGYDKTGGFT